jgi:hypothetical protein
LDRQRAFENLAHPAPALLIHRAVSSDNTSSRLNPAHNGPAPFEDTMIPIAMSLHQESAENHRMPRRERRRAPREAFVIETDGTVLTLLR